MGRRFFGHRKVVELSFIRQERYGVLKHDGVRVDQSGVSAARTRYVYGFGNSDDYVLKPSISLTERSIWNRRPNSNRPSLVTPKERSSLCRVTQPAAIKRSNTEAPRLPARCGRRSVQSMHARAKLRRLVRAASTSISSALNSVSPRRVTINSLSTKRIALRFRSASVNATPNLPAR